MKCKTDKNYQLCSVGGSTCNRQVWEGM